MSRDAVLQVRDLIVQRHGAQAVRGISFSIGRGERVAIVGESGAGKSLTALAVMGLLPPQFDCSGVIEHDGAVLNRLSDRELSRYRGRAISMIFQDPTSALNPTKPVGKQIASVLRRHQKMTKKEAQARVAELLTEMGLPQRLVGLYPHQLSGGQQQRIMIAMAVACQPALIIADEPTTALDATIQKQVLRVLDHAVRERGEALLLITHALPVVAAMCDVVLVMYAGLIVEAGPVERVLRNPRHPYTRGLLDSQPDLRNLEPGQNARLQSIPGAVPPLGKVPAGCAFRNRCARATEKCLENPGLTPGESSAVACHHPLTDSVSRL